MVEQSRFDADKVSTLVATMQRRQTLDEDYLFKTQIYFRPNQKEFSVSMYQEEFLQIIELAATYGGAIITIEGHSNPSGYQRKKEAGESDLVLRRIMQSAKNLSFARSNSVRDAVISYAENKGVTLDPAQFAVVGYGVENPRYPRPRTQKEFDENMRVDFRIIQVEAEEDVFVPFD